MWLPSTNQLKHGHQNPTIRSSLTSSSSFGGLGYHEDVLRHGCSSKQHSEAATTLAALNYYLERGERRSSSSMLERDYNNSNNISVAAAAAHGAPYSSSRWCPTPEQLRTLEDLYRRGIRTPTTHQIQQITGQLRKYGKIEGKNVFYWFQNHKARERQKIKRKLSMCNTFQQQLPPTGDHDIHQYGQNNNQYGGHHHQQYYNNPMIDQRYGDHHLQYVSSIGGKNSGSSHPVMLRGTGLEAEQTKSNWISASAINHYTLPPHLFHQETTSLLSRSVVAKGDAAASAADRDVWMPSSSLLVLDTNTSHHLPPAVSNEMWHHHFMGGRRVSPYSSSNSSAGKDNNSGISSSNTNSIDDDGKPKKTLNLFPMVVVAATSHEDDDKRSDNAPSTSSVDDSDCNASMNFFQFLPLKE